MNGKPWTSAQLARLKREYAKRPTGELARELGHSAESTSKKARALGLAKDPHYLREQLRRLGLALQHWGKGSRFQKGSVPFNKGLRGWQAGGRSRETQFKSGNYSQRWDAKAYTIGALRIDKEGYIGMKVRNAPGARAWRMLHVMLWEDAYGPVPPHHMLRFRDGDSLNVEIDNLELITRAENLRRNSIHNLPPALRSAIHLLGQLRGVINEKQSGRSAKSSLRDARSAAG